MRSPMIAVAPAGLDNFTVAPAGLDNFRWFVPKARKGNNILDESRFAF